MSYLNGSSDLRCLSLINCGRSAAHVRQRCAADWSVDWSRSALTRGWLLHRVALLRAFGVFALCGFACAVISVVSAIGPLLEGMSWCSWWPVGDRGPPRPLGPMHSVTLFPPTSNAPAYRVPRSSFRKAIWKTNAWYELTIAYKALVSIPTCIGDLPIFFRDISLDKEI